MLLLCSIHTRRPLTNRTKYVRVSHVDRAASWSPVATYLVAFAAVIVTGLLAWRLL